VEEKLCKDMPPLELAIQFHGHICPGLLMGVRVAEFAQEYLGVGRDYDEELVAVVETDSCAVDAIQAILGCTFGKGNLVFKDYGKSVFTIGSREKSKAIRFSQNIDALAEPQLSRFRELNQKNSLSSDEVAEKENLVGELFEKIMTASFEELFNWREVPYDIPAKARIHNTIRCAVCGEGVMETRVIISEKGELCPSCQAEIGGE